METIKGKKGKEKHAHDKGKTDFFFFFLLMQTNKFLFIKEKNNDNNIMLF